MRISAAELFGLYPDHPDITGAMRANADVFLPKLDALLDEYESQGRVLPRNKIDGTYLSRYRKEDINAGWRPRSCPIGAPDSSHKQGRGGDVFDPEGDLDDWLTDEILARFGLYREHPASTRGWCHLTDRAPASGRRTFYP